MFGKIFFRTLFSKLDLIIKNQTRIMDNLKDLQDAVAQEDAVIDSAVALINGMAEKIAALPPDADAIAALATDVKAKAGILAAAVTANTPVEAPPTDAPPTSDNGTGTGTSDAQS